MKKSIFIFTSFSAVSCLAQPYLGVQTGLSHYEDACLKSASSCKDDVLGYGIFAGYNFSQSWAMEIGVLSYGEPQANYPSNKVSARIWGGDSSIIGYYPLAQNWQLFGRLGATWLAVDKSNDKRSTEIDPLVGVGIRYSPPRVWALHSEYRFIDGVGNSQTQQADLHALFVGFSINFDLFNKSEQKSDTHTTARPVTIDTTETKVISTHDSLSVVHNKTLFTFNSAKLENTPLLSQLLDDIQNHPDRAILVEGHTDDVGDEAYNLRLSVQRAKAVADFFIQNGVEQNRIKVIGLGETQPIATNHYEDGRQKNRRVEITFPYKTNQIETGKQ
ncbi:OmpA family protein [Vibrio aestuarianus]|uniref:OmpA family protein n=1 Tax=Vibrio aestuarianus TaxID=28171 RepID=A0A9X4F8U0_9VIBR|nr:OmpA family protein [Vibrio aestuarianus]MDE1211079.1 OmpA family protein [Vibrio aestuarianus]MDE1232525.1 OmpA family protein [Vibrio aestuarianus]MDE1236465.1 OmpA family protein [Vibrio aestuarianus]MDE1247343.1 OmpA family protein [Vibrio aestuarianus]MDE1326495.1 OmpA family protein [Vibrio aestuarianus]